MSNIPFGNKGPDKRIRLTGRIAHELTLLMNGRCRRYGITMRDIGIPPQLFEPLRGIVAEAKRVPTGFTMNLGLYESGVLEALRRCLKAVEHYCGHTQVEKATRKRRMALDSYLGVSAVDRLAEIV